MRPPHGKFRGQAGKTFSGEPTAKSEMTDFWPSLLAWNHDMEVAPSRGFRLRRSKRQPAVS